MKMTREEFDLLHLRPALYNGTTMSINVVFDNKSFWRTEAQVAESLGLEPVDTVEIFGEAADYNQDGYKYRSEKFYMSGDVLTSFIKQFGFQQINVSVCFKVKFQYIHEKTDFDFKPDDEIIAFVVQEICPTSDDSLCGLGSVMNDYFTDGVK